MWRAVLVQSQPHIISTRPTLLTPQPPPCVLELLLRLRGLRPGLQANPIQHDLFFVEEPQGGPEPEATGEPHGQAQTAGGGAVGQAHT